MHSVRSHNQWVHEENYQKIKISPFSLVSWQKCQLYRWKGHCDIFIYWTTESFIVFIVAVSHISCHVSVICNHIYFQHTVYIYVYSIDVTMLQLLLRQLIKICYCSLSPNFKVTDFFLLPSWCKIKTIWLAFLNLPKGMAGW